MEVRMTSQSLNVPKFFSGKTGRPLRMVNGLLTNILAATGLFTLEMINFVA
jgi:hypothetical protein